MNVLIGTTFHLTKRIQQVHNAYSIDKTIAQSSSLCILRIA